MHYTFGRYVDVKRWPIYWHQIKQTLALRYVSHGRCGKPVLPTDTIRRCDVGFRHGVGLTLEIAASGPPGTLPVVCFAVGDLYGMPELYVSRLFDMLGRHCPQPFTLYCYTDRPRRFPGAVEQRDCAGWTELVRDGIHPTICKLGLFNPRYVEFERFLYLDLSLIVRRDMSELIAQAFSQSEDLVIVAEWKNDGYNSSVMRIHRGGLACIYEAFVAGECYEQRVPGDQDFILGVVLRHGLEGQVAHFPRSQIVSFKKTVQVGRRSAPLARQLIQQATIVKFHGYPKMHEAFSLRYGMHLRMDELLHGNLRPVMSMRELRNEWVGPGKGRY